MKVLELFAGTRSISRAFEARGHETFTIEWDKQHPDISWYADIGTVTTQDILEKFGVPDVVWASPDCTSYSVAAISKHRIREADGNLAPKSDYAKFCDKVNEHVIDMIKELLEINPNLIYFIENPRGGMRKMNFMKGLPRYTVTYCQYGESRMKPTDLWTNHPDPRFKLPCKNGDKCHTPAPRGSATGTQGIKGAKDRSRIPKLLCEHIVDICEGYRYMLRVFEAFAGYGSQSIALRNLGIEYEVIAISEIDKYAIKAYEAIHGPTNNLGDICKINPSDILDHDLFTYSFPCQDLSVAGKQAGLGKGTRSGLLYECEKIIEAKRPKYLLLENVKNLVGKKFKPQFDEWLEYLESLGYTNYWQVLNAKDYGVPQNRERVFVVSILGKHEPYKFAEKMPLDKCIADILEDEIDEKYYLSEEIQKRFKITNQNKNIIGTTKPDFRTIGQRDLVYDKNGVMGALVATDYKQPKQIAEINQLGMLDIRGNEQIRRVYGIDGVSPTLNTMQGGNRQPKILEIGLPCICASRGRNPENPSDRTAGAPTEQRFEFNTKGTSNTITTVQKDNYVVETSFRIRKLTPRECFRLMGMRDDDIDKIQAAGISNTQQYKMAGNSIVVDVLEAIFKNLFMEG